LIEPGIDVVLVLTLVAAGNYKLNDYGDDHDDTDDHDPSRYGRSGFLRQRLSWLGGLGVGTSVSGTGVGSGGSVGGTSVAVGSAECIAGYFTA
jgi:hypothetical protein